MSARPVSASTSTPPSSVDAMLDVLGLARRFDDGPRDRRFEPVEHAVRPTELRATRADAARDHRRLVAPPAAAAERVGLVGVRQLAHRLGRREHDVVAVDFHLVGEPARKRDRRGADADDRDRARPTTRGIIGGGGQLREPLHQRVRRSDDAATDGTSSGGKPSAASRGSAAIGSSGIGRGATAGTAGRGIGGHAAVVRSRRDRRALLGNRCGRGAGRWACCALPPRRAGA